MAEASSCTFSTATVSVVIDEQNGSGLVRVKELRFPQITDDVLSMFDFCYEHPAYGFRLLWDLRNVTLEHVSTTVFADMALTLGDKVRRLRERAAARRGAPKGASAMLVKEPLAFGISRLVQGYLAKLPIDFAVFYDEDEARVWLEQPREEKRSG